jgi:tetratricopeptide (TPR) repeat protein
MPTASMMTSNMKNRSFLKPLLILIVLLLSSSVIHAKDQWIQVRSKNFFLIGNAAEKDVRKVGTRLEQFRETFRLLFTNMNLTSSIPTNVVVFKSGSSYKPFKPKRADGKIDEWIAGYFQPGEDVNYITLSTEGEDKDMYGTIFHEYVHYIVETNFGKSDVPPWFNEGLAEYYQTFEIEQDQKVKLGYPQSGHLALLQQTKLAPLSTLFNISQAQLHETGNHSRNIFYAQSWALIHYLIQGKKGDGLGKFLGALVRQVAPEKAFQDAFQMSYAQMEAELKKYVAQGKYQYNAITFKNKLVYDNEMQVDILSEAATSAYLGDLLYHIRRENDAEPLLLTALRLDPASTMANTTLGMVKLRQRKFDDARGYLERAISGEHRNHLAYYRYAYLLSREGQDEFGYSRELSPETAAKMRNALKKAISIDPTFGESYDLLAFISMVTNEGLDEALAALQSALKLQPGNQRYAMRIAELYVRQNKFADAAAIAEKIARTTDEPELRQRAETLAASMKQMQEFNARNNAGSGLSTGAGPRLIRSTTPGREMNADEVAKIAKETELRSINESLREPQPNEKREIGRIAKIDCKVRPIAFSITTAAGSFTLTSKDFQGLDINSFSEAAARVQVGCDENLSKLNALVTYRTSASPTAARGELTAVEFVPDDFRLLTAEEMRQPRTVIVDSAGPGIGVVGERSQPSTDDMEKMRRDAIIRSIQQALPQPGEGEKREMGYLDKVECTSKAMFFHLRTSGGTLKLLNATPNTLPIRIFTPDLEGARFGCGMSPVEFPAVVVYKAVPDPKAKSAGTVISVDFVPKSFVLN